MNFLEDTILATHKDKNNGGPATAMLSTGIKNCHLTDYETINKYKKVIFLSGAADYVYIKETIKKLDCNIITSWWMGDFRTPNIFNLTENEKVDYLFIPFKNYFNEFNKLSKKGAYYMPAPGCFWDSKTNRKIDWDVVFFGNPIPNNPYHKNRPEIFKSIQEISKLKIISGEMTSTDQSDIYNKSKISLSVSTEDMIGGSSNRLYNILASKGFALVNYFPEIEMLFENNEHIVWFKDKKELQFNLKYYLNNLEYIEKIKVNAQKLFNEKHSGICRLKNMIDIMQKNTNLFYGYL